MGSEKLLVLNDQRYTVIANEVLKSKMEMTLIEAKLLRLLVTQVAKEDKDLKTYTVNITQLARFLQIPKNNLYRDIKTLIRRLMKRDICIHNKDGWTVFLWLQQASYNDKTHMITLMLSEQIKPFVLDLNKWFTQYKLSEILYLDSFYAIRLYELLQCFLGESYFKKEVFEISILKLREYFACESKYKTTRDFLIKTVSIAIREINAKTELSVESEYIKQKNKIVSVKFTVMPNFEVIKKNREKQLQQKSTDI